MHSDRDLVEKRIERELWQRVLPLVHTDRRELHIEAGPDVEHLEPFDAGSSWGRPWGTTWFRLCGEIPESWRGARVEAVIDLGFHRDAAGFQCEGLVVAVHDGTATPLQGIHPRRTNYRVTTGPGPLELHVEAASNPMFPQFVPSVLGSPDTAGERLLYRFRTASIVTVDAEAESLAYDIEVLDGVMRSLHLDDPRRTRLLHLLAAALDRVPDVAAARRVIAPALNEDFGTAARHRAVAIGHAHIDTAWLWPIRETVRKCTRTFASATALMDDYPEYKFAASSAQHYAWIEERHPALFARIAERVARGQWVPVGGMWVEADMNLPSGESLVRQIVFGQRYFEERFGRRCTEVWIPDVFGYPAGLPQVFAAGGMTRFVTQKLSWNKQNRFPHSTFWWEGLDGTRVLTHFPPVDTYNAEITPAEFAFSIGNFRDHGWSTDSLMPFGHGDGGGGPTREMLERARRLASISSGSTLEIDTPDAMFTRIEHAAARGAEVPVWRGELYFETHRGTLTSQLRTKLGNRRCERLLVEAELWAAVLGRRAEVDDLWREVLTQQFHDILPGSSIAWVHTDAEAAFAEVGGAVEQRIDGLLDELASGSGASLANRADADVDEVVLLDAVADVIGDRADVQHLDDGRIATRVCVPAFGVEPVEALPPGDRVVVSDSSMTNGHLAVRWDAGGNLTSVIDLARARDLIPSGQSAAVVELAPDHPVEYDAWDLESWTRAGGRPLDATAEVTVIESGPLVAQVRVERAFGPSTVVVTYQLRAGARQVDVDVDLDWHHDEHLLSIAFPLDVRADTAMCDVQFGTVARPTHPSSPWDAAKFEVCAHRYVSVGEPDFGVAICNDGRFGHHVFGGAVRVSLARAAKYPDPGADHGHHRVTLAIRPHDGDLGEVRAAASRLNQPLRVVAGGGSVQPIVRITGLTGAPVPNIEVDAVKLADDDTGDLIVRIHEACGRRTRLSVVTPDRVTAAWRCNLLEEPQSGEEVGDGVVTLTVRPFQIITLRLCRSASDDGRSLRDAHRHIRPGTV